MKAKLLTNLLLLFMVTTGMAQIELLKDFYVGENKSGSPIILNEYRGKKYLIASVEVQLTPTFKGSQPRVFSYDGTTLEEIKDANGNYANFLGAYFPENEADKMIVNVKINNKFFAHTYDGTTLTKISDARFFGGGVKYKGKYYFTGAINGKYSLFYSDGTEAGTGFLRNDVKTFTNWTVSEKAVVKDVLVFAGSTTDKGVELWKTDGTEAGTVLLKDIYLGSKGSKPKDFFTNSDKSLLFFSASTENIGRALWVTDGTAEGTKMIHEYMGSNRSNFRKMMEINGKIYFSSTNSKLCVTDGTPENTVQLIDSEARALIEFKNELYFIANKSYYKTNGTIAGTVKVTPDNFGAEWRSLPVVYKNEIYFGGGVLDRNGNIDKREPWKTDGTPEGTVLLKAINKDARLIGSIAGAFVVVGDELLFDATKNGLGSRMWKTDGTEIGTVPVTYSVKGSDGFVVGGRAENVYKNQLLITADVRNGLGRELYVYNGKGETASNADEKLSFSVSAYFSDKKLYIKGLEAKNATLKVFDILGKTVQEVNFRANRNSKINIDVKPGIYIANILTEKGRVLSKKIIVNN